MKTALVTTCWLDDQEYFKKTLKWYDHYKNSSLLFSGPISNKIFQVINPDTDMFLIDNASHPVNIEHFKKLAPLVNILTRDIHHPRLAHVDYRYLWYAVEYYQQLFNLGYEKIIYMDNDMFLVSKKAFDFVKSFDSGWTSPWCPRHKFLETGLQIITKDSVTYQEFMKEDPYRFNGVIEMEYALAPFLTKCALKGDRYDEYATRSIPKDADFLAQVTLGHNVEETAKVLGESTDK